MSGNVGQIVSTIAAACSICIFLFLLTRGLFKAAVDVRDNKNATLKNTEALKELSTQVDGRMTKIEDWIKAHDAHK